MNYNFSDRLKSLLKQSIVTESEIQTVPNLGDDDYVKGQHLTPDYEQRQFTKTTASRAGQRRLVEPLSIKFAKRFLDIHGVSHGETPTGSSHGKNVSRLASHVRGLVIRNEVPISHLKNPESKVWKSRFKGISGLQDMLSGTSTPVSPEHIADTDAWMARARDERERQERAAAEAKPNKKPSTPRTAPLKPISPAARAALSGKLISRTIKEDLSNHLKALLKKNYKI